MLKSEKIGEDTNIKTCVLSEQGLVDAAEVLEEV